MSQFLPKSSLLCMGKLMFYSVTISFISVHRLSGECLKGVCRVLEGVWKVCGGCVEGVWRVPGRCWESLEDIRKVSGGYLECVRKVT